MTTITSFFGNGGTLSKTLTGYQARTGQIEMAEAIADAIETERNFIAEAGTGTGKTFAYLVPAILSGKKVVVSTGTKNLQDQLFNNDLPLVRKALNVPCTTALLKGRSNYLCAHRLQKALDSTFGFNQEEAVALTKINSWVLPEATQLVCTRRLNPLDHHDRTK